MTWNKLERVTDSWNEGGQGSSSEDVGEWGLSPWGNEYWGGVSQLIWTTESRATDTWSGVPKVTDTWSTITRAT